MPSRRTWPNHLTEWTEIEEGYLMAQRSRGTSWITIARQLGRTPGAVRTRYTVIEKRKKEARGGTTNSSAKS